MALRDRRRISEITELAFLTVGSSELELIQKSGVPVRTQDGMVNHVAFTVADIDAVFERLRARGATLLNEAPVDVPALGARLAFFRGPDGERMELFSRQPK